MTKRDNYLTNRAKPTYHPWNATLQHFARSFLLKRILILAETYGIAPADILAEIDLDAHTVDQTGVWIESSKLVDAVAYAAILTNRKDFGLTLGMNNNHRILGTVGILVEHCVSMNEAITEVAQFNHRHNSALRYSIVPDRDRNRLRVEVLAHGKYPQLQYMETLLTMTVHFWRTMLGPQWCPISVMFEHESSTARESYRRVFGCPVNFGSEMNCIVASRRDFERRITPHDGRIMRLTQQMLKEYDRANQKDLREQIHALLPPLLPTGDASAAQIARHLSMTPRTLQRQLAERGTTLKQIVTEARLRLARDYMRDKTMTVTKLAPILGFSESSAVSRFLRQNGTAPEPVPQSSRKATGQ